MDSRALERDIFRIGMEIFERAAEARPSPFSIEHFQAAGMQWLTRHDDLKQRVFRFIGRLPTLSGNADVARALHDELGDDVVQSEDLPLPMRLALAYRRTDSWHAAMTAQATRMACARAARQFICGSTAEEAIASVQRMRRRGMTFTLDVLGETVSSDAVAREQHQLYIHLIERLSRVAPRWPAAALLDRAPWGSLPRVNVSVKLTGIVAHFDPANRAGSIESVCDRLRPILRTAMRHGAFVNVDMEHYAVKDMTLEIFKAVLAEPEFAAWPDCGIVIQAYLRDAERDMTDLIEWARRRGTPITVRLVKGAYWDTEVALARRGGAAIPVYTRKWESDACFERAAAMMMKETEFIRPAFASHNVRSIAAALALERRLGLAPNTVEFQMLTGMGDPLKRALVAMKQRLRVYAPFGNLISGMAYLIRRLIENTANESFLRQSFSGEEPLERLLADPASNGETANGESTNDSTANAAAGCSEDNSPPARNAERRHEVVAL